MVDVVDHAFAIFDRFGWEMIRRVGNPLKSISQNHGRPFSWCHDVMIKGGEEEKEQEETVNTSCVCLHAR